MTLTHTMSIQSDVGMIVLYDPLMLRNRVKAPATWWKNPLGLVERTDGRCAVWPLGDGRAATRPYRARLGDALDAAEESFLRGSSEANPIRVEGDELFLGPVERLPADGAGDRLPTLPDGGEVYPAEPGNYTAAVHVLDWRREERFWNEDNEPTADAPPDFVVVLARIETDLPPPPAEPKPLLEMLPKKTPLASKKVIKATRPKPVTEEFKPKRGRKKAAKKKLAIRQKVQVRARAPGELGVGATVRHGSYGVGEVLFMRKGFPKVKVRFNGGEHKVDTDDLSVVS